MYIFSQENAFENVGRKLVVILPQSQCVNTLRPEQKDYRQVSNISCTSVGNKIVDHSDVVGASPVGAAPTTSSLSP